MVRILKPPNDLVQPALRGATSSQLFELSKGRPTPFISDYGDPFFVIQHNLIQASVIKSVYYKDYPRARRISTAEVFKHLSQKAGFKYGGTLNVLPSRLETTNETATADKRMISVLLRKRGNGYVGPLGDVVSWRAVNSSQRSTDNS